jgi:signal transduction histidine kinase
MHIDELASLVSDFIDISKLEENKIILEPEKIDINALILNIIEKMSPTAKYAGVNLWKAEPNKSLRFTFDKNLISRTITNLILNAVKFTPKGGDIIVHADIQANSLIFSVKDSGMGIPPG